MWWLDPGKEVLNVVRHYLETLPYTKTITYCLVIQQDTRTIC